MKVFTGTACTCVAPLAHRVLEALVQMRVFSSNKGEPGKSGVGSWMEDESVEIVVVGRDESADSGGEPGSGDEDALRSFTAKDRAWRVLREEKRAHARAKKQLVEVNKRVTVLERRLAAVDGQGEAEAVERTLMQPEDRDVSAATLKAPSAALARAQVSTFGTNLQRVIAAHAAACEKGRCDQVAARMKLELELETLQSRYEAISERLVDAESDAHHWKAQQQSVLSELVAEKQETARLRTVKKTAVLMVNRQHVQLHARATRATRGGAPQSLPHLPKRSDNDSNTRSSTHVKTGPDSATA
ncbi:hypothetical protein BBJ28_00020606 [Nothophytophthora sp. Chile5]|nr:hypothetical protein BBJ28_00020606 [Nothophytophthora sp. Chile5]